MSARQGVARRRDERVRNTSEKLVCRFSRTRGAEEGQTAVTRGQEAVTIGHCTELRVTQAADGAADGDRTGADRTHLTHAQHTQLSGCLS